MAKDPFDDLVFGNATPAFSFKSVNTVRGKITGKSTSHRRDIKFDKKSKTYEQGDLLYWGDDNKPSTIKTDRPVLDPVLTLQTTFKKWEGVPNAPEGDDDGIRRLFVVARSKANPGSVMDAFKAACRAAKSKVNIGDYVEMRRVGGKGSVDEPFTHAGDYWTAENPPEWASELPAEESSDGDADDPFA